MITLQMGEVPEVPDKYRCPICGDKLTLEIDAWTEDYDGTKAADDGVHVFCVSEPDITDDDFEVWLDGHYKMPYVDWLPVDLKIYAWLEDNYRFVQTIPTHKVVDDAEVCDCGKPFPESGHCRFCGARSRYR